MVKNYTLLVGNYGYTNIGDMLLKKSAEKQLSSDEVKVMSPGFGDFPIFTIGFRSLFVSPLNNWKAYKAILNSEKIVFGGGGLFNSQNRHSLWIWGSVLCVSILLRKNVQLIGQSFSSVPKGLLLSLLKRTHAISVRDKQSLEFLKKAQITATLVNDLALTLNTTDIKEVFKQIKFVPDRTIKHKSDYVLFNARTYNSLSESVYRDIQSWISKTQYQVVFVAFDKSDVNFYNKYLKDLGVVISNPSVELFSNAKKIVGMRLHFLLVAKKLGLEFTPLSYAPKIIGMFGSNQCVDLYNYNNQKNPLV